ncbi:hypothetical protein [Myroides odoratimimus]|uniref:hypothetical protein n=1 Tax=Myroides odoratimimus TaxID=76832 RepID=UPI00046893E9|nr:hypothetical protein [Myroides odoratimimus]
MELSLKDKIKINILIKEYKLNKYCEFLDVVYDLGDIFNINNKNNYLIKSLSIDNNIDKKKIKLWELRNIRDNVFKNDIIIIADEYFRIKVRLLFPIRFFIDFINKSITKYQGLDISFYNISQEKLCLIYDDEHFVSFYMQNIKKEFLYARHIK